MDKDDFLTLLEDAKVFEKTETEKTIYRHIELLEKELKNKKIVFDKNIAEKIKNKFPNEYEIIDKRNNEWVIFNKYLSDLMTKKLTK